MTLVKSLLRMLSKQESVQPITVVSGLPRSGTSMMMKMLEAGGLPPLIDHIRTPDHDNPNGYYEFERVKKLPKGDNAWLVEAQGKVVKVIAMLLPYLPAAYSYRVIFMRRAMPEILASQRKMLLNRGENPDKISAKEMTRLFEGHLHQIDIWLNTQTNIKSFEVHYNQFVTDSNWQVVEHINQFLGGKLDVEKMAQVVDPMLYRQRKEVSQ